MIDLFVAMLFYFVHDGVFICAMLTLLMSSVGSVVHIAFLLIKQRG